MHVSKQERIIRESVDSLCRDGTDTPIVRVHTKPSKIANAHVLSLSGHLAILF